MHDLVAPWSMVESISTKVHFHVDSNSLHRDAHCNVNVYMPRSLMIQTRHIPFLWHVASLSKGRLVPLSFSIFGTKNMKLHVATHQTENKPMKTVRSSEKMSWFPSQNTASRGTFLSWFVDSNLAWSALCCSHRALRNALPSNPSVPTSTSHGQTLQLQGAPVLQAANTLGTTGPANKCSKLDVCFG